MRQSAHCLWRHVAWSTACIYDASDDIVKGNLFLVRRADVCGLNSGRRNLSRNTEVSHKEVAILVEHQILRLDVSVDNTLPMDVLQGQDDAGSHESSLFLIVVVVG